MNNLISIDCGGSKTDVLVLDFNGKVLNFKTFSGISYSYVKNEKFVEIILKYIESSLNETGLPVSSVKYVILGSSGVYRQKETEYLREKFNESYLTAYVISDIEMAFYSAFPEGIGIILSVGTGSICYGIDKNGNNLRIGGWGYLLGDEGSGYYIGRTALNEVIKNYDRGENETKIYQEVLKFYELTDINDIIPLIYKSPNPVKTISNFAPEVICLSEKGEKIAEKIIDVAIDQMTRLILNLYHKGDFSTDDFRIRISGGLLSNNPVIFNKLKKKLSDFDVRLCEIPHVFGGVFYLLKRHGFDLKNLNEELNRFKVSHVP